MFHGITEEDEENDEEHEIEDADHFGPELPMTPLDIEEPVSPLSPFDGLDRSELVSVKDYVSSSHGDSLANGKLGRGRGSVPLTAEALARMEEDEESVRSSLSEARANGHETPASILRVKNS